MAVFQKICALNAPRLGSFGELIFAQTALQTIGDKIQKIHDHNTDYILNGRPIDVKTTITDALKHLKPYAGKRIPQIDYALVEITPTGVRVSIEKRELRQLNLDELEVAWNTWSQQPLSLPKASKKEKQTLLQPILREIKEYFQKHGVAVRIIYRTCEKGFGKESPGNLVPKQCRSGHVTAYLSFFDADISRDNLFRLVAFPDEQAASFLQLKKPHLHLPKVDLDEIPSKYSFENIDDLKTNYFKRFE